ncbi:MAG: hypothetical protein JEZ11_19860 [Desulfobacterales bacterium]|nr:hypothetical protein [Desulfobacterales bacterium]
MRFKRIAGEQAGITMPIGVNPDGPDLGNPEAQTEAAYRPWKNAEKSQGTNEANCLKP